MINLYTLMHGLRKKKNSLKKLYYYIENTYKYPIIYNLITAARVLEISVITFFLIIVLHKLNIIQFNTFKPIINYIPDTSSNLNQRIVFTQISVTFFILSLFSLIISLKKEKTLGTSLYKIAFSKSVLGNIIFISLAIFSLLFLNIFFFTKDKFPDVILTLFLLTLFLLTILIIKIILYSNSQSLSRNKIESIYYWENKKRVVKPRITWRSDERFSKYLYNLNEDTLEKILRKDIEYRRNFYVYENITNITLFNHKYKVQENYTEIIYEHDLITMWASCIEELINNELYTDAIAQYNKLISLLTSHEIYLSSFKINDLLEKIFVSVSATESKVLYKQNKTLLLASIELTMGYSYYKENNDFSYTRLGKLNQEIYLRPIYSKFLNNYYTLIEKDIGLSEYEKALEIHEYFEALRTMSLNITNSSHLSYRHIKYFDVSRELNKYNENVSLVGVPLSKLLLLLMRENNKKRIIYFLKQFNDNSIYFSCLIVASELTTLYFQLGRLNSVKDKGIIEEYLILLLAKLVELEDKKIKTYTHTLTAMGEKKEVVYDYFDFSKENVESLKVIRQVLMMKKKNLDLNKINFSNKNLGVLAKLFIKKYKSSLINEESQKANDELKNKFGVFIYVK